MKKAFAASGLKVSSARLKVSVVLGLSLLSLGSGWTSAVAAPPVETVSATASVAAKPVSSPAAAAKPSALAGLSLEQVLDKAYAANGTAQQMTAKGLSERLAVLVYQGEEMVLLSEHVILYDFVNWQMKITNYEGDGVSSVDVITPHSAVVITDKTGAVPMPRKQAEDYRRDLRQARWGLGVARQPGSQVKLLGAQEWSELEVSGTALEVKFEGDLRVYLLDDTGLVIAEKFTLAGEPVLAYYTNFTSVEGLMFPTIAVLTNSKGQVLLGTKRSDMRLNPSFSAAEFEAK